MNRKKVLVLVYFFVAVSIFCGELRILNWNVENFFDTIDNPNKNDTVLTQEEYDKKFQMVASVLKEVDADVVSLCEIENMEILSSLAKECGYDYAYLIDGNDDRGINVCVLSKYEMDYKSNKEMRTPYPNNQNYRFSRDCPVAHFVFEDKNLYVLPNHLKSMLGNPQKCEAKRIAQVNGILDIISEIYEKDSNPYIIITGDMNAHRYSEPLNILQKSGLIIVNYKYPEFETFTHKYHKKYRDLDYFIINDILDKNSRKYKMKTLHFKKNKISDHYPILLTVSL